MQDAKPQRPLTPRQLEVLRLVADAIEETGIPPTVRAIGRAAGITSSSNAHLEMVALQRRGLLAREPGAVRGLTVTAAGYALLGRTDPAEDAALGRALRAWADRDPVVASVLAKMRAVA